MAKITAIYSPKGVHASYLDNSIGKKFKFEYAFSIDGIKSYEPVDIQFPSSNPIKETDLVFSGK